MRIIRSLLAGLALTAVVVAGALPSTTAAFTDATAATGNTVATGSLTATAVDATMAQPSATSIDVAWGAASVPGSSLAPSYTVERSATADGANPTTIYTGGDTRTTDAGSVPAEAADIPFTAVAAAGAGTAALAADGAVYTWGPNGHGQLGNGSTTRSTVPTRLGSENFGGEKVVSIDVGSLHVVAVTESGAVYTWGNSEVGQIGNGGTATQTRPTRLPASAFGGQPIVAVTAGAYYTVALAKDGSLFRWGLNQATELGVAIDISRSRTPQRMDPLLFGGQRITAVEARSNHTVALAADGTLYTWGANESGQLGTGDKRLKETPHRLDPSLFEGLKVTSISAGDQHIAVLAEGGAVFTWGSNAHGQLGVTALKAPWVPVRVPTDSFEGQEITAITAGSRHTLVTASGALFTWGDNSYGQLGRGGGTTSSTPTRVAAEQFGQQGIAAMAAGSAHSVAVGENGALYTWGNNGSGQLGNGLRDTSSDTPQHIVVTGDPACAVGATTLADGSCSLVPDTTYYYRVAYTLGNWSAPASAWTPLTTGLAALTPSGGDTSPTSVTVTWPAATRPSTYTLERSSSADGSNPTTVYTGSDTTATDTGNLPAELAAIPVAAIAAGELHTIALTRDGEVYTWGNNWRGQLGNRTVTASSTPVRVEPTSFGGHKIVAVAAGEYHSVALADDGRVWSWGYGEQGQLGHGIPGDWLTPVPVSADRFGGQRVAAIAAGGEHTVALTENGELYTWGSNAWGQLGDIAAMNSLAPMRIDPSHFGGRKITSIAAGASHTVVVVEGGAVFGWGKGGSGQIGDGGTDEMYWTPTPVDMTPFAGQAVVAVAAGELHTVALTADGKVYAWGYGNDGALGNGTIFTKVVPTPVDATLFGENKIVAVAAGERHTLAVTENGVAFSWGDNADGQLGHDASVDSSRPAFVDASRLGGRRFIGVAAGQTHAIALMDDGGVVTWGSNVHGQVGGSATEPLSVPTAAGPTRPYCAPGAVLTGDRCSLTPHTTYLYRVTYTSGDRAGPASAWTPLLTGMP